MSFGNIVCLETSVTAQLNAMSKPVPKSVPKYSIPLGAVWGKSIRFEVTPCLIDFNLPPMCLKPNMSCCSLPTTPKT